MKTSTLILLILFSSSVIFAQRNIKYKDVYEIVLTGEREEAYAQLLAYQKQDPDFANTYFQLGLIADYWARNYDPLTEYDYVKSFIYDTKLYYGLAILKLKDEKRRNTELYSNGSSAFADKDFSIKDISDFVETKVKRIEAYEEKITEIVGHFNKSSDNYNECLSIFKEVNEDYAKIKNIWMSNEPKLNAQLDLLQAKFDTTLQALDNYKKAINDFPIKDYNQRYALKNIYTYRLHGLEPANFLNDNIELWDYNSWVEQIRTVQNSTVSDLRSDIIEEQEKSDKLINKYKQENYYAKPKAYTLENTLLYRIERIDYQSIISSLFQCRESYINFLSFYRNKINAPEQVRGNSLKQIASYYYELIEKNQEFYESLEQFEKDIVAEKIDKHKNFLKEYYGGQSEIEEYAAASSSDINKYTSTALSRFQKYIDQAVNPIFPENLKYKNKGIFYPGENFDTEAVSKNAYYVQDFEYKQDSICNFTGFYLANDSKLTPFYAQLDTANKISYLKTQNISDYPDFTNSILNTFESGQLVLFSGKTENGNYKHNFIRINNEGKEYENKSPEFTREIVKMQFDDINNIAELIARDSDNALYYSKYDLQKNEILFTSPLNAWGDAFDILRFEKNNYVFINYEKAKQLSGETIKAQQETQDDARDIVLIITDDKGKITNKVFFPDENNMLGRKAIKLDSKTINLTATLINKYGKTQAGPGWYLILDTKGEIIWQNRHN